MNKTCSVLAIQLMIVFSPTSMAEYKSKSVFSKDYKCVSESIGGFKGTANGHKLTRFKKQEEFFLTHISNLPEEAIMNSSYAIPNNVDRSRELFEKGIMTQEISARFSETAEYGSYAIRYPVLDPRMTNVYIFNRCGASYTEFGSSISCYKSHVRENLNFNMNTMRFTYSNTGNWHQIKKGENPSSAYFIFGTCKEYYR